MLQCLHWHNMKIGFEILNNFCKILMIYYYILYDILYEKLYEKLYDKLYDIFLYICGNFLIAIQIPPFSSLIYICPNFHFLPLENSFTREAENLQSTTIKSQAARHFDFHFHVLGESLIFSKIYIWYLICRWWILLLIFIFKFWVNLLYFQKYIFDI